MYTHVHTPPHSMRAHNHLAQVSSDKGTSGSISPKLPVSGDHERTWTGCVRASVTWANGLWLYFSMFSVCCTFFIIIIIIIIKIIKSLLEPASGREGRKREPPLPQVLALRQASHCLLCLGYFTETEGDFETQRS